MPTEPDEAKTVETMSELAALAGVSSSTVSRALNRHPSIPEATRAKIQALALRHRYRINAQAQNLRLRRSLTVAAIFPQGKGSGRLMSDPFYLEIVGAISDELSLHGYDLLVSLSREAGTDWYERYLLDKRADGLLVLERDVAQKAVTQLQRAGVPFVVWGPVLPGQSYVSVGGDSYGGAKRAVRHLLATGRKTVGFVGGDRSMVETAERYRGYKDALQETGLESREALVAFTDYTPREAKDAVRGLLAATPELDALFFCSDFMALAAFETLVETGKRVPADVAVIAYDDIPLAEHCQPSLSTVRQEVYAGGRLLVKKLLALLAGDDVSAEMLPVTLKIRASCP